MFESVKRQEFRDYFQPSRITIGIIKSKNISDYNLITLCFSMYCSYKPNMIAFSIQRSNYSYKLLDNVDNCVLAIPGEKIAEQTLYCGDVSGNNIDKVTECGFTFVESKYIKTPGLLEAKSNIELEITDKVITGDHMTIFGIVKNFYVNKENKERNLISVGADHQGYDVIAKKGIHRIAVVEGKMF